MSGITSIGRVIVPASDQDAAIAFYTGKLGFTVTADVPFGEGERWVEVSPPGGGAAIALAPPTGSFQPGHQTGISLSSRDARAEHAALKESGVDVDDDLMGGDGTVPLLFGFRDSEGNNLMVVEQNQ